MRSITESIFIGFCLILLAAMSSNSQGLTQTPKAANKLPVTACAEKNGFTQEEINKIIVRHNKERTLRNVPNIVWDCKLAQTAQEWASRGVAEHSDSFFGENIFVSTHHAAHATQGVKQWIHEKKRLEPGTMKCKAGKICLHYTQVIAANSERLGCGINRNATGKWKVLIVCNYDPAGNVQTSLLVEPTVPTFIFGR